MANKKIKTVPNGSYISFDNGRITRTYGAWGPMGSIDTSGYGSGKKEFALKTSSSYGSSEKKVKKEDVPKVISELKKGATRFEDYRSAQKKKSNK
jgi:hypothetical protein